MNNFHNNNFLNAIQAFKSISGKHNLAFLHVHSMSAELLRDSISALNWAYLKEMDPVSLHQEGGIAFQKLLKISILETTLATCSKLEKSPVGKKEIDQCLEHLIKSGLRDAIEDEISLLEVDSNPASTADRTAADLDANSPRL